MFSYEVAPKASLRGKLQEVVNVMRLRKSRHAKLRQRHPFGANFAEV